MRGWLITLLIVCMAGSAGAQQMEVMEFARLKRPFWKRSKVSVDKQKAIIDLKTAEQGFTFVADGKEQAEAEEGDGVITVKVPDKTRYLIIKHEQYGSYTWRVPAKYLKRKKHYSATLLATDPTKVYKPQQQWVLMDIEPKNAIVRMDSTVTLLKDGQYSAMQSLGWHNYLVEAPFYEAQTDSFLVTDTARVSLSIRLQPAYSYVTVKTPWEYGDIYIDGQYVAKREGTSHRLQEGMHRLSVLWFETPIYDNTFNIGRSQKQTITLTERDSRPQPVRKGVPTIMVRQSDNMVAKPTQDTAKNTAQKSSEKTAKLLVASVMLKAGDSDTEIWVDREHVGTGQWQGDLALGYHIISTKKDDVESDATELWLVDESPQEISLAVPETTMALLNIHSNVTGAVIYINEVRMGTTPCLVESLPSNRTYTVCLRKKGYRESKAIIKPRGNELTDVKIKMKQK